MNAGSPSTPSVAAQLGLNLRRFRASTGKRQEDIAARAGVARSHYAALESGNGSNGGEANPRLSTLLDLAAALEVPIGSLLEGLDRPAFEETGDLTTDAGATDNEGPYPG